MTPPACHGFCWCWPRPGALLALATLWGALVGVTLAGPALAQGLVVQPYLQMAAPDSIRVMWETADGDESLVYWGPTDALGEVEEGNAIPTEGASRIHDVLLEGLSPQTRYFYKAVTGDYGSEVYDFVTPPAPDAEQSFRLVAMSDMQKAWAHPDKFEEVIHDGVLSYLADEFGEDLPVELAFSIVPGDLVDNGLSYAQWGEDFFAPSHPLFAHVPVYPVLGNHENDTDYYFQYFHLPENGSTGSEEHWWHLDYSNLRLIGLDSNSGYATQEQLDWLEGVLEATCDQEDIDFVFAQLHHPHKSELWLPGESNWTGDVVALMESFTADCGKPSIHFFGHTHGYSRGQSRDHDHLWVNVATAGGAIDHWGDYPQADYDEFTVTLADWGFVLVEVEAGDAPLFRLQRVSRGDDVVALDNEVRDSVEIRRYNEAPLMPEALSPADGDGCAGAGSGVEAPSPDTLVLVASLFGDEDGDLLGASHFQVSTSCDNFDDPRVDLWFQHENWYFEEDLQVDDDLSDAAIHGLEADTPYCWRVRYRDRGLRWSPWSSPAGFTTGKSSFSDNLLLNPGAEQGTDHWTVTQGVLESLSDGECNGVGPFEGERYFSAGGLCEGESDYGEARQNVNLEDWLSDVEGGLVRAHFGGMLRDWSGDDRPEIRLVFLDEGGAEAGESETIGAQTTEWTDVSTTVDVPSNARSIDFVMMGTRNAGDDNDSYLDEVRLQLQVAVDESDPGDDDDAKGDDDSGDTADDDDTGDAAGGDETPDLGQMIAGSGDCSGCRLVGASGARVGSVALLALVWLVSTRRRRR